jgi:hypothetical protein
LGGCPQGHLLPNLGPLRGRSSAELDGAHFHCTRLSSVRFRERVTVLMNDLQQGFGSLHYAYLTIPDDLGRLCHFALRAAFPLSLVGRDSW